MNLTEIESFLEEADIFIDLDPYYARFCLSNSGEDRLAFVQFLADEGVMKPEQAQALIQEWAVEVTDLNVLGEFYDHTQMADRRQQTASQGITQDILKQNMSRSNHILLEQIGAGAMGSIHLARDRFLRRTVAFKKLLENISLSPTDKKRFLGEVQITSQLDHPHVVPIYNLENNQGEIAYSMKVVRGRSLKEWLADVRAAYQNHNIPQNYQLKGRLTVFLKICDALDYAHSRGIIHRDLKPANIMLGAHNEVYVMDWGIAKPFQNDNPTVEMDDPSYFAEEIGQVVGTPRYMSPEQAAGMNDKLNHLSDQFALGLILFEMVTLTQAIQGSKTMAVLKKVIKRELEPLKHRYGEKIPPPLVAIINKATARRRADRYATTADLGRDLRRFLRDEPIEALEETAFHRLLRQVNRYRSWILIGILGSLLLGAATSTGIFYTKYRALASAELRRIAMGEYLSTLAHQSQRINGQFLKWEQNLQAISAASYVALSHGLPSPHKAYLEADFRTAHTAPPDYTSAPAFGFPVSLEWPVFLSPASGQGRLERQELLPIRYLLQRLFLAAHDPQSVQKPIQAQLQTLRQEKMALYQAFIRTPENTLVYPGQISQLGFPWEGQTKAHRQKIIVWGQPQLKSGLLPVIQAIETPAGNILGSVGLFFRLEALSPLLGNPFSSAQAYLVQANGEIVIGSEAAAPNLFAHFPQAHPLKERLEKGEKGGYFEGPDQEIFAFSRINRLGWYYVQQIPLALILEKAQTLQHIGDDE